MSEANVRRIDSIDERQQALDALLGHVATDAPRTTADLRQTILQETGLTDTSLRIAICMARATGLVVQNGNKGGFKLTTLGEDRYQSTLSDCKD